MNNIINFTEQAAARVWELIEEDGNPNLKLRVYVTGGGCSGFKYGFTFEEEVKSDYTVITREVDANPVHLLVDAMSLQLLIGAEIDYEKSLTGEEFIIRNPNAKTTCGCGSSFSAE
jgi:iron-sulfur cluster insertion protein